MDDFSKVLVAFGIRSIQSNELTDLVLNLVLEKDSMFTPRSIENIMFFIDRCVTPSTEDSYQQTQAALNKLCGLIK